MKYDDWKVGDIFMNNENRNVFMVSNRDGSPIWLLEENATRATELSVCTAEPFTHHLTYLGNILDILFDIKDNIALS